MSTSFLGFQMLQLGFHSCTFTSRGPRLLASDWSPSFVNVCVSWSANALSFCAVVVCLVI